MKIHFNQVGDFKAMWAAEEWCRNNGISYGPTQAGKPRGLKYGDYAISKWKNLDIRDIALLDGKMTGDMRNGPVCIEINDVAD